MSQKRFILSRRGHLRISNLMKSVENRKIEKHATKKTFSNRTTTTRTREVKIQLHGKLQEQKIHWVSAPGPRSREINRDRTLSESFPVCGRLPSDLASSCLESPVAQVNHESISFPFFLTIDLLSSRLYPRWSTNEIISTPSFTWAKALTTR